jgi:PKHD-type hydroxylase
VLIAIPRILAADQMTRLRAIIEAAEWTDGTVTSGTQARMVKNNLQLPEDSEAARRGGQIVMAALSDNPLFIAAALPHRLYPPMFNSYSGGQAFGNHVDNALRIRAGTDWRVRADLSMTIFLAEPDEYDGGELVMETEFGPQRVKLAAGDGVLYPASSLHRVEPVTRGRRLASFFWIQSMVRDAILRDNLFRMDQAIQALAARAGLDDPAIISLTGCYHNLLRHSADA